MAIESCGACPWRIEHLRTGHHPPTPEFWCQLRPADDPGPIRWIGFIDRIPEWCPLTQAIDETPQAVQDAD